MEKIDDLATLSSDYPWLVAYDLDPEEDDTGDQIFYTLHDPLSHYRCRIPELVGRRIRGCFYGWMILSKRNPQDIEWSLWNPLISKLICFPPIVLKDDDKFYDCCLSSPPDDPDSLLLLMRSTKLRSIVLVFCNPKRRKRLRQWTEVSYYEQLKNVPQFRDHEAPLALVNPTCCNGNIYALALSHPQKPRLLIQVQINVVEEERVVINLVPLVNLPWPHWEKIWDDDLFLKGSCTQLYNIRISLDLSDQKPREVYLYKLDMSSMVWTEIKELNDTVFFVSLAEGTFNDDLVSSSPPIASELGGGYIHILEESGDEIYSYNIKDKTISMSSTRCLGLPIQKSISIWTIPEYRLPVKANCKLEGGRDEMVQLTTNDDEEDDEVEQMNEAPLLNVPFDVLENIMKFCVGIEYLNFRATCKLCRLAAPMHKYSSASPWLMVLDKNRGLITFTDPMFGHDNYYIKASPELFYRHRIMCSRYGWLLLYIADRHIAFFNPLTTDICKLPELPEPLSEVEMSSFSFSASPTSRDCVVVAFSVSYLDNVLPLVAFHRVGGEPSWYTTTLEFGDPRNQFYFPICCGEEDVYTMLPNGRLQVFREIQDRDNFSRKMVVDRGPIRNCFAKYYYVKCEQHHLLVIVEEYGESVEVFKLNDCTQEWEEVDGLERHMIYICDASCVCMDAKIPEMENKIYFPRFHSKNGRLVFYSLETRSFHTFNGRNVEQTLTDLFETKLIVNLHAWIQPTWS